MLAVAGGKGGVGKTTTALLLARALARRGARPVVADADAEMPDLAATAGLPPGDGIARLARGAPLSAATAPDPREPDLRVACVASRTDPAAVPDALTHLRARPCPVVVDCPAGCGPPAATPLRAADFTLLVSTDTPASLTDAAKTARMARALGTPVVGCLVRTSEYGEVQTPDVGVPVLGRLSTVDSPLTDDRVRMTIERCVAPITARTFNFV